ncbi:S-adenosyl-L-methionine-dependent methyltransferase [Calycina marina]|uniref:S-adenosyl-L-methionine-dependent methyltransferase n=1 Tax=Calycina marina TaxID=1763456 RepID=A0A9P7Z5Y7_9HELO|nr:S-adenosyl-L-methionine-dependent methyltransferase [Calycina marina]
MAETKAAEDHWSSKAYQSSASFVPKLATKVVRWLDVQPDDKILDIGCGDGVINLQVGEVLKKGSGKIHGTDASEAMIRTSKDDAEKAGLSDICTFEVLDTKNLIHHPALQTAAFDKVFSNAALHWILRPEAMRRAVFAGVHAALRPHGRFVFEMGGMGNVAEMRTILLAVVARRVGIVRARAADPWFFPDEEWMEKMLVETGFVVERIEREYRPTKADEGGVEGWTRLMGKQFFDAVAPEGDSKREECIKEALEVIEGVCESPGGGSWFGYVRLRAIARKI